MRDRGFCANMLRMFHKIALLSLLALLAGCYPEPGCVSRGGSATTGSVSDLTEGAVADEGKEDASWLNKLFGYGEKRHKAWKTGKPQEEIANQLLAKARAAVVDGKYHRAMKYLDEIIDGHIGFEEMPTVYVLSAYSHYATGMYDKSLERLEAVTDEYPAYDEISYAYYLMGMCHYMNIKDADRDQNVTQEAIKAFETITKRYPNSVYASDAAAKINYGRNLLIEHEMRVGHFYMSKMMWLAAAGRYEYVLQNYEDSIFTEEALYRLVEIYSYLGIKDKASMYFEALGSDHPNSRWYSKAGKIFKR